MFILGFCARLDDELSGLLGDLQTPCSELHSSLELLGSFARRIQCYEAVGYTVRNLSVDIQAILSCLREDVASVLT